MKRKFDASAFLLYVTYIVLCLLSANVMQGALAFGAFVGAMYCINPLVAAAIYLVCSVVFGWTSLMHAAVRCGVMLIFVLVHHLAKRKMGKLLLLLYTLCANVFFCAYKFTTYFQLFDKLLCVACGIAFGYVCIYTFRAVFVRGLAYRPALDEFVCIALFGIVVSLCFSFLEVWGLQVIYFVAPFALLFCAFCFGDVTALVCGVIVGLGNLLATGEYGCCVFCVVSALAALALGKVNRYLSALGVLLVDVIMSYFLNLHGSFTTLVFAPTFVSTLIFCVIPTSVFKRVNDYACGSAERYLSKSVAQTVGQGMSKRLYRLSDIFLSIKNAFFTLAEGHLTQQDAQKAMAKACGENVCATCAQRTACYRKTLAETENNLLLLANCALKRGKCTILDVPQTLSVKCDKISALLAELNSQAANYRNYLAQTEQADSSKTLLAQQMGAVSHMLLNLATDCKSATLYDSGKEQELVEGLTFHNVLCVGATIAKQGDNVAVIATVSKKDSGNVAAITKVATAVVKKPMIVVKTENTESNSWVNVHLAVQPRYTVSFGVAQVAKSGSEISGDTHTVTATDNGKCIVALVDGMGSGAQAEQMSATAIELVENFYRAGFDNDVILACVNNLLAQGGNDVFCAVDIAVLDVNNGLADFVKLGATWGLVKCANEVQVVTGSSLPLGVLDRVTPSVTQKALASGDVLVLFSDGIVDCFADVNTLAICFAENSTLLPQSIAETILNKALKTCNNTPKDDMTVVVAKLA